LLVHCFLQVVDFLKRMTRVELSYRRMCRPFPLIFSTMKLQSSIPSSVYNLPRNPKVQSETRLKLVGSEGDYKLGGVIKDYRIEPATRNSNTGTAENQLTITVRLDFLCEKHPEKNKTKEFSFFRTYDASKNLSAVEGSLSSDISDNIVQQIFADIALDW